MIGILSLLVLIHCIYSLQRYRKFLLASKQPLEHLPLDIIVEITIGAALGMLSILTYTDKFKNVREFFTLKTYDASFNTKNLNNYNSPRAQLFLNLLKEKYNTQNFQ